MSKTNTGGSAFPYSALMPSGPTMFADSEGMTLRDYFAAKAMQGLLELAPKDKQQWTNKLTAETAYKMADAMLEARKL